jgi:hypothetical protein
MVMAAERKISRTGIHSNSGLMSAIFLEKKVSTQKKINKLAAKNAPSTIKAAGLLKNALNSFLATRNKVLMAFSPFSR